LYLSVHLRRPFGIPFNIGLLDQSRYSVDS
jgi:hypothetical protein